METEREEGVVERVVTYLKDLVGAPPDDNTPVDGAPVTAAVGVAGSPTATELMQKYPEQGVPESALDMNTHSARLEDGE